MALALVGLRRKNHNNRINIGKNLWLLNPLKEGARMQFWALKFIGLKLKTLNDLESKKEEEGESKERACTI